MEIFNKMIFFDDTGDYTDYEEMHFGMCLACGEEHYNCEPDASRYTCEHCGAKKVEGLCNLLMMGKVTFHES